MIRARRMINEYMMPVENISPVRDKIINFKFDTGASRTIISINALTDKDYAINEQEMLLRKIQENSNKNLIVQDFKSASGDSMTGIKCCASNILVAGLKMNFFYYYLVFGSSKKTALIGDDFISCCDFKHLIKGDIIINSMDTKLYDKDNQQNKEYINSVDMMELINLYSNMEYTEEVLNANYIYKKINDFS